MLKKNATLLWALLALTASSASAQGTSTAWGLNPAMTVNLTDVFWADQCLGVNCTRKISVQQLLDKLFKGVDTPFEGECATWDSVLGGIKWQTCASGGGAGTVTSVGLAAPAEFSVSGSPVTGAGTLTLGKANQSANTVWAGPTSGGAAAPAFRALADDDIPNNVTIDLAAAANALAANGSNCSANQYPLGVNASGAAESCTADDDTPDSGDFGALALTGDVTSSGLVTTIASNSVALGADTTNNYVASVATTAPLSGGAAGSEGGALTLSLSQNAGTDVTADLEEETHGSEHDGPDGDFVTDAGDTMTGNLLLDNQVELRFGEADGSGSNYIAFKAPSAISSDVTCTLENDGSPIPDSCVGDGVDDGGGSGDNITVDAAAAADANLKDTQDILVDLDTGTAPDDITFKFARTATLAGNPAMASDEVIFGTDGLLFEVTADAFETLLKAINPTADRTIQLPNETGTVCTTGSVCSGYAASTHASSHQSGGSDAIKLDDLAAPDDNTDLNASATKHGLLPKLSNSASQYLDGTGSWSTPSGAADPLTTLDISDDFVSGSPETGEYGSLGWNSVGGTSPTYLASESGEPGIVQQPTPATDGAVRALALGNTQTLAVIFATDVSEMTFRVRLTQTSNCRLRIGLLQDVLNTGAGTDGVYAEYHSANSTFWQAVTKAASTETRTTSTVTAAAATWTKFRFVRNGSGNWEFYINGTLEATHTTNKPTVGLNVALAMEAREAVAKSGDIGFFRLKSGTLSR